MWADRLRNVKSLMEERGYECLFISPGPNLRYLTGFYFPYPGEAWDAIWNEVKVGLINDVGRKVIGKGGYGKYFRHGIGHGLGLEVHEVPHVTEFEDVEMVLQAGLVMIIEPAVYLLGEFNVRIEDDVLVTDGGKEILSTPGKEFVQI